MSETTILSSGSPLPAPSLVTPDDATITGDGTSFDPLRSTGRINPARALFVATSWAGAGSPDVYFTTIKAALDFAATMTPIPTRANPVVVVIFPGTYTDDLELVSNVHLSCHARRDVVVTGAVTWTIGAGINARVAALGEEVDVTQIRFEGTISIDSTGKPETGQGCALDARGCDFRGDITVSSRVDRLDHFQSWTTTLLCNATFRNTIVNLSSGTYGDTGKMITMTGGADADIDGDQMFGSFSLADTSVCTLQAVEINAAIAIGSGCALDVVGSVLKPASTLAVAAGGVADVRCSDWQDNVQFSGPGTIDRSIWTFTVGPTAAGANAIVVDPPYPDALYNVALELTAAGAYPPITGKTGAGFTLTDPVGGNTYHVTLLKGETSSDADTGGTPPY